MQNHTRNEWRKCKTTLETSGEDVKLHSKRGKKMLKKHSKRVEKMQNHTRFECIFSHSRSPYSKKQSPGVANITDPSSPYTDWRAIRTLRSWPNLKLHSKRVEKMWNYARNELRRCETTLETSGEDVKLRSKRVKKMWATVQTSGEDVKVRSKRVER
jgi:hypothetical protein